MADMLRRAGQVEGDIAAALGLPVARAVIPAGVQRCIRELAALVVEMAAELDALIELQGRQDEAGGN